MKSISSHKPVYVMPLTNLKRKTNNFRVLGIDPGYERLGVAIVEKNSLGKETLIYSDCIRTDKKFPHPKRLAIIANSLADLIEKYSPTHLATETLFFENNQKTAMKVSEARGVIIAAGSTRNLIVCEYTPLQIKVATTGDGRADKKQIMRMVPLLVKLEKTKLLDDEYDAIAVALTCLASERVSR